MNIGALQQSMHKTFKTLKKFLKHVDYNYDTLSFCRFLVIPLPTPSFQYAFNILLYSTSSQMSGVLRNRLLM